MRKLLFLLLSLLFLQSASAQLYADGVLIDNTKAEQYLLINPTLKRQQYSFTIECGDCKDKNKEKITNAQGEPLLFDSLAASFDFFYKQGWEFCSTISNTHGFSDGPVDTSFGFLLQRRK